MLLYLVSRKDRPGGKFLESLAIALQAQAALEYRMGRCQVPLMGGRLKLKALVATTMAGWAYPPGPLPLKRTYSSESPKEMAATQGVLLKPSWKPPRLGLSKSANSPWLAISQLGSMRSRLW